MVTINLFATYRLEAGVKSFQLDIPSGLTIGKVILATLEKFPVLKKHWLTSEGEMFAHVIILLNGSDIYAQPLRLDTPVQAGDQLGFFPPLAGG